jgi:hypothetical protein
MENEKRTTNGRISPEKAWQLLKKGGLDVTLEQAQEILNFLRKIANVTVSNYLKRKKNKLK